MILTFAKGRYNFLSGFFCSDFKDCFFWTYVFENLKFSLKLN